MKRQGLIFSTVAVALAAAVTLLAMLLAEPSARAGVAIGASAALALQVGLFWLLAVWLFPGKGMLAYGLGLLARFAVFALLALLVVPAARLPFGPTLFTLAGVFWVTTLVEPLFLKTRTPVAG